MKNPIKKLGINIYSFSFNLWFYFTIIAILVVLLYTLLGILTNVYFFSSLVENEIKYVAKDISNACSKTDYEYELQNLEYHEDIEYAVMIDGDKYPFFKSPTFDDQNIVNYYQEMLKTDDYKNITIIRNEENRTSMCVMDSSVNIEGKNTNCKIFVYSSVKSNTMITNIYMRSYFFIGLVILGLAMLFSYILSKKLSKPLNMIGGKAKQLATGNYDISFDKGVYTEIESLSNTLQLTAKQLAETEDLKNELVANVSHDLKTPLTLIKSYAEMIRDISGNDEKKRNEHLDVIINEAQRLNVLVNDMVDYSRIEASNIDISLTEFSISELVKEVVQKFKIMKGYRFEVDIQNELYVIADRKKITQVVYNLLSNAFNYTENQMYVGVSVKKDGLDRVKISISDSGNGISQEDLQLIWNRYYRTKNTHKRGVAGSGLGLSIVKGILTKHDIEFGVVSNIGKGSTFYFYMNLSK